MEVTLQSIKQKIAEKENELNELKAAYKVLSKLSGDVSATLDENELDSSKSIGEAGAISIKDIKFPEPVAKKSNTLLTNIKSLIERLGDQSFTARHVEFLLKEMGKGSDSKHFRNRVSKTIKRLVDEGYIKKTSTGKGIIPNKYARNK